MYVCSTYASVTTILSRGSNYYMHMYRSVATYIDVGISVYTHAHTQTHTLTHTHIHTQKVIRGDMLLSLLYNPVANVLQGILLKATNLRRQNIVGLAGIHGLLHSSGMYMKCASQHGVNYMDPMRTIRKSI